MHDTVNNDCSPPSAAETLVASCETQQTEESCAQLACESSSCAIQRAEDDLSKPTNDTRSTSTSTKQHNAFGLEKLPGESVIRVDVHADGKLDIAITSYRLVVSCESLAIFPTCSVDSTQVEEQGLTLVVYLKDGRTFKHTFCSAAACSEWRTLLADASKSPMIAIHDLPACQYYSCVKLRRAISDANTLFHSEYLRLGFSGNTVWRVTEVNSNYSICATYPPLHVVPTNVDDVIVTSSASYRSNGRFPSVVWRSARNGSVLMRASQPCVGIFNSHKDAPSDVKLVKEILEAVREDRKTLGLASTEKQLLVLDCRSQWAISFNYLTGGGTECVTDYDERGTLECGSLPNVTGVRNLFQNLRAMTLGLTRGEDGWLRSLAALLCTANRVAHSLIQEHVSVLVHCSDGWDRTPQVIALAKLLIDPYYRTIQGFATLVEREFAEYGHKFAERCGHDVTASKSAERAPIFIQFLDCVHQLCKQQPKEYEFGDSLLLKLAYHVHSCLFGTFLGNSKKERDQIFRRETLSVWTLLDDDWKYRNPMYSPSNAVLRGDNVKVKLWSALYLNRAAHDSESIRLGCNSKRFATSPLSRSLSEGRLLEQAGREQCKLVRHRTATLSDRMRPLSRLTSRRSMRYVLGEIATGGCDVLVDIDGLLLTVSQFAASLALRRIDEQLLETDESTNKPSQLASVGACLMNMSLDDLTRSLSAQMQFQLGTTTCKLLMDADSTSCEWERIELSEASAPSADYPVTSGYLRMFDLRRTLAAHQAYLMTSSESCLADRAGLLPASIRRRINNPAASCRLEEATHSASLARGISSSPIVIAVPSLSSDGHSD